MKKQKKVDLVKTRKTVYKTLVKSGLNFYQAFGVLEAVKFDLNNAAGNAYAENMTFGDLANILVRKNIRRKTRGRKVRSVRKSSKGKR